MSTTWVISKKWTERRGKSGRDTPTAPSAGTGRLWDLYFLYPPQYSWSSAFSSRPHLRKDNEKNKRKQP